MEKQNFSHRSRAAQDALMETTYHESTRRGGWCRRSWSRATPGIQKWDLRCVTLLKLNHFKSLIHVCESHTYIIREWISRQIKKLRGDSLGAGYWMGPSPWANRNTRFKKAAATQSQNQLRVLPATNWCETGCFIERVIVGAVVSLLSKMDKRHPIRCSRGRHLRHGGPPRLLPRV